MKAKGWPGWDDKIAALQEQIAGCIPFVSDSDRGSSPPFLFSDPGSPIEDGQSRNVKPYQVQIATGIQPTPIALNPKPGWVTITNLGTKDVWLGGADVTPSTGQLLPGGHGNAVKIKTVADWWGICNPGESSSVSVIVGLELAVFFLNQAGGSSPILTGGKFLGYSTNQSATGNSLPAIGDISIYPFTLGAGATFSRIVFKISAPDALGTYDVGIYPMKTGGGIMALAANIGGILWTPGSTAKDLPFVQGSVTFAPGEYLLAWGGGNGGAGNGTIEINQPAGLYFPVSTTSTTTGGGVLPASISVVEGAAASGFGNPPTLPEMILY